MTKKAYLTAQSKDWKNAQEQRTELVEILYSNYKVKQEVKHDIFLIISKQETADIEIFLTG